MADLNDPPGCLRGCSTARLVDPSTEGRPAGPRGSRAGRSRTGRSRALAGCPPDADAPLSSQRGAGRSVAGALPRREGAAGGRFRGAGAVPAWASASASPTALVGRVLPRVARLGEARWGRVGSTRSRPAGTVRLGSAHGERGGGGSAQDVRVDDRECGGGEPPGGCGGSGVGSGPSGRRRAGSAGRGGGRGVREDREEGLGGGLTGVVRAVRSVRGRCL